MKKKEKTKETRRRRVGKPTQMSMEASRGMRGARTARLASDQWPLQDIAA